MTDDLDSKTDAEPKVKLAQLKNAPLYLVSTDGCVYGPDYGRKRDGARLEYVLLKPRLRSGYPSLGIYYQNGVRRDTLVHRMVLETFVGPAPEGMECAHGDGDRKNNALSNLRWATHVQNVADKADHGTNMAGEKNGVSKLRSRDLPAIIEMIDSGMSFTAIGKFFGVSRHPISKIAKGLGWKNEVALLRAKRGESAK